MNVNTINTVNQEVEKPKFLIFFYKSSRRSDPSSSSYWVKRGNGPPRRAMSDPLWCSSQPTGPTPRSIGNPGRGERGTHHSHLQYYRAPFFAAAPLNEL
jgi:hypothetical protein